jgi:hypothetical protein
VYQQADGGFVVAFAKPKTIFSLVDRPDLASLADDVDGKIRGAFQAL